MFLISCGYSSQEINQLDTISNTDIKIENILNRFQFTNYYNVNDSNGFFIIKENERFYSSWFLAIQAIDSFNYKLIYHIRPSIGYTGLEQSSDDEMNFCYTRSYSMKISKSLKDSLISQTKPIASLISSDDELTSPQYIMFNEGNLVFSSRKNMVYFEQLDSFVNKYIIKKIINNKMNNPSYTIDSLQFNEFRKTYDE